MLDLTAVMSLSRSLSVKLLDMQTPLSDTVAVSLLTITAIPETPDRLTLFSGSSGSKFNGVDDSSVGLYNRRSPQSLTDDTAFSSEIYIMAAKRNSTVDTAIHKTMLTLTSRRFLSSNTIFSAYLCYLVTVCNNKA